MLGRGGGWRHSYGWTHQSEQIIKRQGPKIGSSNLHSCCWCQYCGAASWSLMLKEFTLIGSITDVVIGVDLREVLILRLMGRHCIVLVEPGRRRDQIYHKLSECVSWVVEYSVVHVCNSNAIIVTSYLCIYVHTIFTMYLLALASWGWGNLFHKPHLLRQWPGSSTV